MLMTSLQMIFATAVMLAQPAHYDDGRAVRADVVVARPQHVPPRPPALHSPKAAAHRDSAIRAKVSKPANPTRVANQPAAPHSRNMPRTKIADLRPAANVVAASSTARPNIAASRPVKDGAVGSDARTVREQVTVATAAAEHATAAALSPAPERKKKNHTDTEKTAAASPDNTDLLVAILMARPEIKSVSDLAGRSIAIDDRQSASHAVVRTAIAAAGAAEVQLSEGQTTPINRVASGEVPAAVLTLVSPEAAEMFPEIAGFKIFRIPLSPRSVKARLDRR